MRLLLDEMLSPAIARALRARGHDVEAVKEHPEWESLPDPDIVAVARHDERTVVTNNLRDFRPLHAELVAPGSPGHAGMVFVPTTFRLSKQNIGTLVDALDEVLQAHPGKSALANAVTWLRPPI